MNSFFWRRTHSVLSILPWSILFNLSATKHTRLLEFWVKSCSFHCSRYCYVDVLACLGICQILFEFIVKFSHAIWNISWILSGMIGFWKFYFTFVINICAFERYLVFVDVCVCVRVFVWGCRFVVFRTRLLRDCRANCSYFEALQHDCYQLRCRVTAPD